jgi:F0F1-type ATP synthase beta subunit
MNARWVNAWNECGRYWKCFKCSSGKTTLGRIFNVLGEVVDGLEEVNAEQRLPP